MPERNKYIDENIGLVHACAGRYTGRGIEYDDLFQAGCEGLVKASQRFDEKRGLKFSTYAVPVILGEIRRLFRDGGSIKVSRSLKELSLKCTRISHQFCLSNGREPSVEEIAEILKIDPELAEQAINAAQPVMSLTCENDEGDFQEDIRAESFDKGIIDLIALRQTITELESRDRRLIKLRYFDGLTQSVTAQKLGMTQVQVSRREKQIIINMREKMTA